MWGVRLTGLAMADEGEQVRGCSEGALQRLCYVSLRLAVSFCVIRWRSSYASTAWMLKSPPLYGRSTSALRFSLAHFLSLSSVVGVVNARVAVRTAYVAG